MAIFTRKLLTVNQRLRLQSCLRCSKVSSKSPKHTDKQAADNQKADFFCFFQIIDFFNKLWTTTSRNSQQLSSSQEVLKKYLDNFFKRFSTTVENWKAH
jgi:hypothetical protein